MAPFCSPAAPLFIQPFLIYAAKQSASWQHWSSQTLLDLARDFLVAKKQKDLSRKLSEAHAEHCQTGESSQQAVHHGRLVRIRLC
jgi:hypothetical protein